MAIVPADAATNSSAAAAPSAGAAAATAAAAAATVEAAAAEKAAAAAAAAAAAEQNSSAVAVPEYFITIGPDGNFRNGCQTFYPAGWNQCVRFRALHSAFRSSTLCLIQGTSDAQVIPLITCALPL